MTQSLTPNEPNYNNATDVLLEYLREMVDRRQFPEVAHYKDWLFHKAKVQLESEPSKSSAPLNHATLHANTEPHSELEMTMEMWNELEGLKLLGYAKDRYATLKKEAGI
jgi:hypothetical protein